MPLWRLCPGYVLYVGIVAVFDIPAICNVMSPDRHAESGLCCLSSPHRNLNLIYRCSIVVTCGLYLNRSGCNERFSFAICRPSSHTRTYRVLANSWDRVVPNWEKTTYSGEIE